MISMYGYDKDNDVYDNLFTGLNSDVPHELPWCANFLLHHARSSSGDEYDWICISKDNRDREEDMIMCLVYDAHYDAPVIVLECGSYKEAFAKPDDVGYCDFNFINW